MNNEQFDLHEPIEWDCGSNGPENSEIDLTAKRVDDHEYGEWVPFHEELPATGRGIFIGVAVSAVAALCIAGGGTAWWLFQARAIPESAAEPAHTSSDTASWSTPTTALGDAGVTENDRSDSAESHTSTGDAREGGAAGDLGDIYTPEARETIEPSSRSESGRSDSQRLSSTRPVEPPAAPSTVAHQMPAPVPTSAPAQATTEVVDQALPPKPADPNEVAPEFTLEIPVPGVPDIILPAESMDQAATVGVEN